MSRTLLDNVYMAGLIDGEGTISIGRDSGVYRSPYLSVSSTTKEIMEWLVSTYGGGYVIQKVYQKHHKPSWSWKLRNKADVFKALEEVLPYMKEPEKVRRGRLILDEYEKVTVRNGKYTPEQLDAKMAFEAKFNLKKRLN